jgi:methylmalonyl-CoA/ethylmalonyl-CoA epimerase
MIHKVNHIAVVVEDMTAGLNFWQTALGLPLDRRESNAEEEVEIAFMPVGDTEIELLQATNPEGGIAKHIAKKGAGLHHVCLEVENIEATMGRLREHGIQLINDAPKTRPEGVRYCFVHPKSTGGVLVELYELPKD